MFPPQLRPVSRSTLLAVLRLLEVNNLMIAISFGMTLGVTISLVGLLPMSGSWHLCISKVSLVSFSSRLFVSALLREAKRGHHAATPEVISKELRGVA